MRTIDPSPTLETARMALRPPRIGDASRVVSLVNDFDIARMTTAVPHPYDQQDAEAYLSHAARADPTREATFAMETPTDGLVGMIGLYRRGPLGPEIGYWIGRPFWGRGLATEAARGVLSWAKNALGRRVVVSGHFADNPASGRVLEKAGFLYTGEIQPRHSIARGEIANTRMMVWLA
jgi:RimJ/RimL family protein N-acetyltransferase